MVTAHGRTIGCSFVPADQRSRCGTTANTASLSVPATEHSAEWQNNTRGWARLGHQDPRDAEARAHAWQVHESTDAEPAGPLVANGQTLQAALDTASFHVFWMHAVQPFEPPVPCVGKPTRPRGTREEEKEKQRRKTAGLCATQETERFTTR